MTGGADVPRDFDRRGLGDLVDGAVFAELDEDVVAPLLVHQRRAGLASLQHVGDGRQFFQFERDGAGNVLCLRAGRRQAHGDHFADVANLVSRQDRLDGIFETFQRRGRDDGLDAGQMFGGEDDIPELLGNVDSLKSCMGNGAAHKSDVASAGHADIADILSPATQKSIILLARGRGSDSVFCHWALSTKTPHGIVRLFSGRWQHSEVVRSPSIAKQWSSSV